MKWVLVLIIVAANTVGDVLNTAGMKHHGEVEHFHPRAMGHLVVHLFRNPFVLGGMASLAISFGATILLLSIADVSFAIPATSGSFLFETILAKYYLKEDVRWKRWVGATFVAGGVALLSV